MWRNPLFLADCQINLLCKDNNSISWIDSKHKLGICGTGPRIISFCTWDILLQGLKSGRHGELLIWVCCNSLIRLNNLTVLFDGSMNQNRCIFSWFEMYCIASIEAKKIFIDCLIFAWKSTGITSCTLISISTLTSLVLVWTLWPSPHKTKKPRFFSEARKTLFPLIWWR